MTGSCRTLESYRTAPFAADKELELGHSNIRPCRRLVCGVVDVGLASAHVHVTDAHLSEGLVVGASLPPGEDQRHTHNEQEPSFLAFTGATVVTATSAVCQLSA
jgi:hypothetical protein